MLFLNSVTIFYSTAIDYDEEARYAFIGDYSGQITVCSLDGNGGVHFINALKGHNGSIQSLCWDGTKGWLYSGTDFLGFVAMKLILISFNTLKIFNFVYLYIR